MRRRHRREGRDAGYAALVRLCLLARVHAHLDRALGRALRRLRDSGAHQRLGFARMRDYVSEGLGQSHRWAQQLIRMDSKLESLPGLSVAHLRGEIPTTKVLAVLPVATEETQGTWIDLARRMTSRRLAAAVRSFRAGAPPGGGREGPMVAGENGDDRQVVESGGGQQPATQGEPEPVAPGAPEPTAQGAPEPTAHGESEPATQDEPEPTERIEFGAPAPVAHLFDHAVDVARRVAGWQAPQRTCFTYMLGEYLAGRAASDDRIEVGAKDASPTMGAPIVPGWIRKSEAARHLRAEAAYDIRSEATCHQRYRVGEPDGLMEALAPLISTFAPPAAGSLEGNGLLDETLPPEVARSIDAACPTSTAAQQRCSDAGALDAHLRRLMKLRQRRHGELSRLLAALPRHLARGGSRHPLLSELTGLSRRSFQELVGVRDRFLELPHVAEAYWRGVIGWSKVRLILRVCRADTQDEWIARATRVTVRRLELEVQWSHRQSEEDPTSWCSDGGPPDLSFLPPRARLSDVRPGAGLWRERGAEEPRCPDQEDPAGPPHTISPPQGAQPAHTISPLQGVQPAHTISPPQGVQPAHTISPRPPGRADRSAISRPIPTPCRIRIFATPETAELWRRILEAIRHRARRPVAPWEGLLLVLEAFLETWDGPPGPLRSREHRTLDRDGYQCAAPGCSARRGLEVHHIVFRSRGGSDEPENLITLCTVHHRRILHEGWMACTGRAPAGLVFALGWRRNVRYMGDVLMGGRLRVSAS